MLALSPRVATNGDGESIMAAKILLAVSMTMSLTAGGYATWVVQRSPVVMNRETLIPLGIVVAVLIVGIGAAVRASRYLDSRDGRIEKLEENQRTLMTVILGSTSPEEGIRRGGLMEKMDRVLERLDQMSETQRRKKS